MRRENRKARSHQEHRSAGPRNRHRRNHPPTRQSLRRAAYAWAIYTVVVCGAGVNSWFAYAGRTRVLHISAQILTALLGTGTALDYWRRSTRAPEPPHPAHGAPNQPIRPTGTPPANDGGAKGAEGG